MWPVRWLVMCILRIGLNMGCATVLTGGGVGEGAPEEHAADADRHRGGEDTQGCRAHCQGASPFCSCFVPTEKRFSGNVKDFFVTCTVCASGYPASQIFPPHHYS
jgi:uncharacterized protein YceK